MDLKTYITPLIRYWWLIVIAVLVATGTSLIITLQQPPIYQTRATLIIGRAVYEANPSANDLWMSQQLANFYADIGMRGEVQATTMQNLGLTWLPEYYVRPVQNSQLLEIVVTDTSPIRAQAVANELAAQLINRSPTASAQGQEQQSFVKEQVTYLEGKIRDTLAEIDSAERKLTDLTSARQIADTQEEISALQTKLIQLQTNYATLVSNTGQGAINTLSVIEPAPLPMSPTGPNKKMIIIVAALIAVVVSGGAAYLLEFLDDSIKTADDVANLLPAPVLANIPMIIRSVDIEQQTPLTPGQALTQKLGELLPLKSKATGKNGVSEDSDGTYIYAANYPRSTIAEEFRSLRINLDFAGVDKPLKSILVTSPSPAEGKTSVATNLAIVVAQTGKKVILIDSDFRKPSINVHFDIPNKRGLSDIFRENLEPEDVVQPWKENILWIITTGLTPPNPVDLLSSQRMNQILEQLQKISDVVIIDGPPLMFPDSLALSTKVDGVLMVLRHSFTRKGIAQTSYKQLSQVGARIIGVVLNKTPGHRANYYSTYHYHGYYAEEQEVKADPKRVN